MKTNIQTILTDVNEQLLQLNSEITDPSLLAKAVTQLIKSTIQQIDEPASQGVRICCSIMLKRSVMSN